MALRGSEGLVTAFGGGVVGCFGGGEQKGREGQRGGFLEKVVVREKKGFGRKNGRPEDARRARGLGDEGEPGVLCRCRGR